MPDKSTLLNCDWIVKYRSWHLNGNSLFISCLTDKGWEAQLIIRAVSKNVWNYSFIPPESEFLVPTQIIEEGYKEQLIITVEENATGLILKGIGLKLVIHRSPWKMVLYNDEDDIVFTEIYDDKDFIIPLGYYSDKNKISYTTQSFCLRPDEYLFGLGEHPNIVFGAGQKISLWNEALTRSDRICSNKNVPFFFSSKGYGMFINSSSQIELEFGSNAATFCRLLNKSKTLDVFLICGSSPEEIIYHYSSLTGKATVPPKWSLGVCISVTDEYLSSKAIDELIDEFEKEHIPRDVLLICPSSFSSKKYSAFMRNTDLKKLFSDVHNRGLKICLRVHPYISIESELYHEAKLNNYLVKKANGEVYIISLSGTETTLEGIESTFRCKDIRGSDAGLIDFTNPDACIWYKELYRFFLDTGADILSTEYGEEIPEDAVLFNGETGGTIHNQYSLLFAKNIYQITKSVKANGTTFSRSGTAGIQRYSICWSHNSGTDFEHLAYAIKRAISSGLSGIPFWVTDIDMIGHKISKELYCRWIQFQMFCSHSRIPGKIIISLNGDDEQTLIILRRSIQLRYSIFPYLYSVSRESAFTGLPVIRSMYLAFPWDPGTLSKDLQYMFGPSLLIAPVFNENNVVSIYFPEGEWINFYTGERQTGGRTITHIVPVEEIPVFVRSGSIIPMMQPLLHIPEDFIDPLILSIYPDKNPAIYRLSEDEGISEFSYALLPEKLIITINSCKERSFNLRINGIKGVKSIMMLYGNIRQEIKEYIIKDIYIEIKLPEILQTEVEIRFNAS